LVWLADPLLVVLLALPELVLPDVLLALLVLAEWLEVLETLELAELLALLEALALCELLALLAALELTAPEVEAELAALEWLLLADVAALVPEAEAESAVTAVLGGAGTIAIFAITTSAFKFVIAKQERLVNSIRLLPRLLLPLN